VISCDAETDLDALQGFIRYKFIDEFYLLISFHYSNFIITRELNRKRHSNKPFNRLPGHIKLTIISPLFEIVMV